MGQRTACAVSCRHETCRTDKPSAISKRITPVPAPVVDLVGVHQCKGVRAVCSGCRRRCRCRSHLQRLCHLLCYLGADACCTERNTWHGAREGSAYGIGAYPLSSLLLDYCWEGVCGCWYTTEWVRHSAPHLHELGSSLGLIVSHTLLTSPVVLPSTPPKWLFLLPLVADEDVSNGSHPFPPPPLPLHTRPTPSLT